ncbi:MAG: Glu/Leu/Phe/Val dehydrogenase [Firmicutes bacterium]|nr:Glu/Leu/Phe/Val dehydrogenase [Bacillota bacterium]
MTTALEVAQAQLAEVAKIMNLEPHVYAILKEPMRQLTVQFPVKMDDGSIKIFEGFRFQHNWAVGPIRGGTRFHEDETVDDVKALSIWMTMKNSLNEIPNGGGKGGIAVDPSKLSRNELERLCRAYTRAIAPIIGPWNDFPGADIGTDNATQSWMLDEWEAMNLRNEPAGISGKAMILGGSEGRAEATSRGLLFATREVTKVMGLKMQGLTAVVQGFGKVGWHLAKLYQRDGVKVIAVSDVNGGIYNADGLDILDVYAHLEKTGSVVGYPKAKAITNAEILEMKCDILAPCAVQNVITAENAPRIKARMIIEGANGPMTPEGERIVLEKGIFDAPDILANSGGTQVAHFERIQNLHDNHWTEDEVNAKLEGMIKKVFKEVYEVHQEKKISMRMACWVKALNRVVEAMRYRGWV